MDAILDWKHDPRTIPESGLAVTREATEKERAGLAAALDVVACKGLVARYSIEPLDLGRFRLKGSAAVTVTQACVVTLEEIERNYEAPLDVELWPADALTQEDEDDEAVIDPLDMDREPIEDGRIDAGRIIYEELVGAIDPYPRSDGAAFDWEDRDGAARTHPFAALEKLKRKGD